MKNRPTPRLVSIVACVAFPILAAACGSSADDAAATTSTTVSETTTTEATTTTTVAEDAETNTTTVAEDAGTTTVDERTDEEIALDQLDLMLFQLGVQDNLVEAADCVVARLEDEGIELVGQGTPELIALLTCEPSVGQTLFSAQSLPFESEQSVCVVDGITGWLASLPLLEAEDSFGETPPDDLLDDLSGQCDVPAEELRTALAS